MDNWHTVGIKHIHYFCNCVVIPARDILYGVLGRLDKYFSHKHRWSDMEDFLEPPRGSVVGDGLVPSTRHLLRYCGLRNIHNGHKPRWIDMVDFLESSIIELDVHGVVSSTWSFLRGQLSGAFKRLWIQVRHESRWPDMVNNYKPSVSAVGRYSLVPSTRAFLYSSKQRNERRISVVGHEPGRSQLDGIYTATNQCQKCNLGGLVASSRRF